MSARIIEQLKREHQANMAKEAAERERIAQVQQAAQRDKSQRAWDNTLHAYFTSHFHMNVAKHDPNATLDGGLIATDDGLVFRWQASGNTTQFYVGTRDMIGWRPVDNREALARLVAANYDLKVV